MVADPLVRLLLGEKWLETIPLIQILAVYGIASVGMANQSPLLISLGHARIMTQLIALGLIILLPAFTLATIEYGVLGGAWAVGLTNLLLFLISIFVTLRVLALPGQAVCSRVWRTVVATTAMAFVVVTLQVDRGDAHTGAEVVEDVALGGVQHRRQLALPWVAFPGHDPVGQAFDVRDAGPGGGGLAGKQVARRTGFTLSRRWCGRDQAKQGKEGYSIHDRAHRTQGSPD